MAQIFGNFINHLPPGHDYLDIGFSPNSVHIKERWKTNRLSAYFVADYLSTFMPVSDDDPDSDRRKEECKGAVSYIANELLENAMKFSDGLIDYPIEFGMHFLEGNKLIVVLLVTNTISSERQKTFQLFIQELMTSNPEEMYMRQVEQSAEGEMFDCSGLGFLTMINDYSAQLGWKFEIQPGNLQIMTVTTMVQIAV